MVIFPSLLILGSEELVQLSLQYSFLVCCSGFSSFVPLLCLREVSEREVSLDVFRPRLRKIVLAGPFITFGRTTLNPEFRADTVKICSLNRLK